MMQQPRFEEACAACARGNLKLRATNSALARAFRDSSRIFYTMFALVLDANGPVTLAALQALSAEFGLVSRGRAAALMMYLRIIGYLERRPEQASRRSVNLMASPKLIAIHDKFVENELRAAAMLEPEAETALARLTEPAFRRAHLRQTGIGLKRLIRLPGTPTSLFAERDAGLPILYQIAGSGDVYPAHEPVRVNLSETARQHEVSRAHVTRLLRDAAAAGLMRQEPSGAWTLLEPLRDALNRLHAFSFVAHCAVACGALRIVDEGGAPGGERTEPSMSPVIGKAAAPVNAPVARGANLTTDNGAHPTR